MASVRERLLQHGVSIPEILLPRKDIDYQKWAVVACDQYSSEPEYWEEADRFVGSAPSTLRLIYPECYLDSPDKEARIAAIQRTMQDYLAQGILTSRGETFVLVERTTPFEEKPRLGLVLAVDLERYQYGKNSKASFDRLKTQLWSGFRHVWQFGAAQCSSYHILCSFSTIQRKP